MKKLFLFYLVPTLIRLGRVWLTTRYWLRKFRTVLGRSLKKTKLQCTWNNSKWIWLLDMQSFMTEVSRRFGVAEFLCSVPTAECAEAVLCLFLQWDGRRLIGPTLMAAGIDPNRPLGPPPRAVKGECISLCRVSIKYSYTLKILVKKTIQPTNQSITPLGRKWYLKFHVSFTISRYGHHLWL